MSKDIWNVSLKHMLLLGRETNLWFLNIIATNNDKLVLNMLNHLIPVQKSYNFKISNFFYLRWLVESFTTKEGKLHLVLLKNLQQIVRGSSAMSESELWWDMY